MHPMTIMIPSKEKVLKNNEALISLEDETKASEERRL
jgi:hypothetical protein